MSVSFRPPSPCCARSQAFSSHATSIPVGPEPRRQRGVRRALEGRGRGEAGVRAWLGSCQGQDPVVTSRGSARLCPRPHRPVDLHLPGGISRAWFRAQSWQPTVIHGVGLRRSHLTPSFHRREARTQTTVHRLVLLGKCW